MDIIPQTSTVVALGSFWTNLFSVVVADSMIINLANKVDDCNNGDQYKPPLQNGSSIAKLPLQVQEKKYHKK